MATTSTKVAETPEELTEEIEQEQQEPDPHDIVDPGDGWNLAPEEVEQEVKGEEKTTTTEDDGEDDNGVAAAEEDEPDAIEIDDDLLTAAVKAGFDIPTARSFGSANALTAAISAVEKRLGEIDQPAEKSDEEDESELDIGLDPDVYEPEIVNAIKKVHSASRKEIKELNKTVKGLLNQLGDQQEQTALREFDGQLNGLGDTFDKDIGKGPTSGMDKRSKTFKTRMQIRDLRDTLRKTMKLSSDEAFRRAYVGVLGDRIKSEARDEVRKEVASRRRQAVTRPAPDNGVREISREQQAIANLAKAMRTRGMAVDEEIDEL